MNLNVLFMITAVIAIIFGLGFLLVPDQMMALYDVELAEQGLFMARYFGGCLVGSAVLAWLAKDFERSKPRDAIVIFFLLSTVLGLIVALSVQFTTEINQLGWLNVVIYLLLALAFAYFQFMGPEEQQEEE